MSEIDVTALAEQLEAGMRLLIAGARKARPAGDVSAPEMAALLRLRRVGPAASSALARLEGISPQAMGVTLAALESRGLVAKAPDPDDGRRLLLAITPAGEDLMAARRSARSEALAAALAERFDPEELRRLREAAPLLERLAEAYE